MDFKACPRCRGDMHSNRDMYGEYKECLQCGYMADIKKCQPPQDAERWGKFPKATEGLVAV